MEGTCPPAPDFSAVLNFLLQLRNLGSTEMLPNPFSEKKKTQAGIDKGNEYQLGFNCSKSMYQMVTQGVSYHEARCNQ